MNPYKYKTEALYSRQRKIMCAALGFLLCMSFAYVYFLCASVWNVVARAAIDKEISTYVVKLNDLETRYIMAKQQVTEDTAIAEGFVRTQDKMYIVKKSNNVVVINNES